MGEVYEKEIGQLKAIAATIETLIGQLEQKLPAEISQAPLQGGFSLAAKAGADAFFSATTTPENRAEFREICRKIVALPSEYRILITGSMWLVQFGPGRVDMWADATSNPRAPRMLQAAKALRYGISLIESESPSDREFRRFHAIANQFSHAASKAKAGTRWKRVDIPQEPVQEYNDEAIVQRERLRAQFTRLDERFITLMNDRLRKSKPFLVAESMAPVECHDDPEAMERIRAYNKDWNRKQAAEARKYQTGEITITDIVSLIDTDDFEKMAALASQANYAASLYYADNSTALTLEMDEKSGEIFDAQFPEPEAPARN